MAELTAIVVSHNSARWLPSCLRSVYAHAGGAQLEIVVVDNDSSDGSAELVEREFPAARVCRAPNRGFSAGNNRGLEHASTPFVLFLNPDTEILAGSFGELLHSMGERPTVALTGCRQLTSDGALVPSMRRFPSPVRLLGEALGSERLPLRASWLGERVLDEDAYDREMPCDWTSGSFMLARREVVVAAGGFDERFFLYCEEPDLCLRLTRLGWEVRHLPTMTIVHYEGMTSANRRLVAQNAHARRQYMQKNMPAGERCLAIGALSLGHLLRAAYLSRNRTLARQRRSGARLALRTLFGLAPPPFPAACSHAVHGARLR